MARRPRCALLALLLAGTAGLAGPGPASAANPVVGDCASHNRLTAQYSVTQLRAALSSLPSDVKEYTDCYDLIDRQLLVQLGQLRGHGGSSGSTGAGGGGGSFLPVPVIVALAIVLLGGGGYAGLVAVRDRRGGSGGAPEPPGRPEPPF